MKTLIIGISGFIGLAVVRYISEHTENEVIHLDKQTYADNNHNLKSICGSHVCAFEKMDAYA